MLARRDGTEPIIAHGNVYLRPAERDDVARLVAWLNDYRTTRTLGLPAPLSVPLEERWLESTLERHGIELWYFVICRLEDDRPVGGIDLHEVDQRNGSAALGIMIGSEEDRGRGYGSDALRALLRFAFGTLRLERVWLDVYDINPGAQRLYERVGFVPEGILRHAIWREGRWVDVVRMAMLSGEWGAGAGREAVPAVTQAASPAP